MLRIEEQPTDTTCGPTALQAVYGFYGDMAPLEEVENGGTLGVLLATHALRRGYRVRIYTYNLNLFDPTWFRMRQQLPERLARQAEAKRNPATYLCGTARELDDCTPDDVAGDPVGHFVVLSGYDATRGTLLVSDPYGRNPWSRSRSYHIAVERVIGAILLGALTYDANLLIVRLRARPDASR